MKIKMSASAVSSGLFNSCYLFKSRFLFTTNYLNKAGTCLHDLGEISILNLFENSAMLAGSKLLKRLRWFQRFRVVLFVYLFVVF